MNFKKFFLTMSLALVIAVSGCSPITAPTNVNAAFESFTLQLFQEEVAASTLGLHYTLQSPEAYGVDPGIISFGTYSTDNTELLASLENLQESFKRFPYQKLSDENKLTHDILSFHMKMTAEDAAYMLYAEPLSSVTGIHAQLPVLLAEYALNTEADVETYLSLVQTLPDYYDSLICFEKAKAEAGLFMPSSSLDKVLEQCNAFLSMGDENYLLSTFEERLQHIPSLTAQKRETYLTRNRELIKAAVIPAYEQLIAALSSLQASAKNEQGLCYLPGGKEYYRHLVAKETGSSRSLEELQALIETQIADDILAMQEVANENPSIIEETSSLPNRVPDTILSTLKDGIADAFPAVPEVSIDIKYVPKALEPHLSPAFYLIPAIDCPEENVIYINGGQSFDALQLFTTLAHEGYPGHLYQTTYYAHTDPDPLRNILNFKGYVEGWATYAEMCSYYLSPLNKPYATLLQKNNSLILGLYARADMGIHGEGWDLPRTIAFFETYGIEDEAAIQEIYDLILSDPANYLAYYVGYLEILELKRAYMRQTGDDFSQKEFHKKFLDVGPAPFAIVNKQINGT